MGREGCIGMDWKLSYHQWVSGLVEGKCQSGVGGRVEGEVCKGWVVGDGAQCGERGWGVGCVLMGGGCTLGEQCRDCRWLRAREQSVRPHSKILEGRCIYHSLSVDADESRQLPRSSQSD
jgi:hypothetical protein